MATLTIGERSCTIVAYRDTSCLSSNIWWCDERGAGPGVRADAVLPGQAGDRIRGGQLPGPAFGEHPGQPAVRGEPGRAVLHAGALHRATTRPAARRPGTRLLLGGRGVSHVLAATRPGRPGPHPDHGLPSRSLPERPAVP